MDHFSSGAQMRHYRYPQRVDAEEIPFFSDGLAEVIPEKLAELTAYADELSSIRKKNLLGIKKLKNITPFTRWFLNFWVEASFSEYAVVQKWLAYWLRLNKMLKPEKVVLPKERKGVTDEEILIAKEFPLEQLYQGVLRKNGNHLTGLCPFHEEKTPSFVIYEDQNRFHCFGACNQGGDAIDFVMRRDNCDMNEAVKGLV